jgi:serine/threonine-protein kinase
LVFLAILLLMLLGSALVARRNVRAGRGDRRGALRIGVATFIAQCVVWILGGHHVAAPDEGWLFISGFTNAAGMGLGCWLVYLALEPFARRRWPQMLISWTRALSGSWRDALVGRDLLIGAVVGATAGLLMGPLRVLLPLRLGIPGPPPMSFNLPGTLAAAAAWLPALGIYASFWVLGIVFFLVLTRSLVRNGWIAGFIVTILYTANYLGIPSPSIALPLAALSVGIVVLLTVRFGLLAGIVAEWCRILLGYRLSTNDPARWDFPLTMLIVAVVAALAWWGSRTALAGRPLFGVLAIDEKETLAG